MSIYIDQKQLLTEQDLPVNYWNLLDGTADFSGTRWNNLNNYTNDNWRSPIGNQSRQRRGNWLGLSQSINYQVNQVYTLSASVFIESNNSNGIIEIIGNGSLGRINQNTQEVCPLKTLIEGWKTIEYQFTVPETGNYNVRFESSDESVTIHWADLMLNKGSIALDWNYSINDLKTKMGGKALL